MIDRFSLLSFFLIINYSAVMVVATTANNYYIVLVYEQTIFTVCFLNMVNVYVWDYNALKTTTDGHFFPIKAI